MSSDLKSPNSVSEDPILETGDPFRNIGAVCGKHLSHCFFFTSSFTTMSAHHRQDVMATHGPVNEMQPPLQEWVDGQTASELASDARNWQNATTRSLEPPLRNAIASKVERIPRDPIPYE